ncbi:hypothetical protein [Consotaella salsifontis]|uniref:Uncharacterized protein n=1 Tax=Consotaella salsifontis TaxID=1365950 RepID=A0A1T4SSI9_9HYPH|nr:hypothetical protein [Consotaella salsifontis]SKA31133.1 hypothetical protein SAMN05428963_113122 [Consotaella salsifontis]
MTDYSHVKFSATNPKQLRTALLHAIQRDYEIDKEIDGDPSCIRHGVFVGGRHIGYQGSVSPDGRPHIHFIQSLGLRRV